ncbi:unnamed protein product [Paramecium sonneborni]|uniref:Uncharacterized protein n=1 Tax=Paramecium sonneborni TaxID=65129 RepID=A0A8S1LBX2_9CILI|nr:unnamed protein product [Paramecium sonneborni]
MQSSKYQTNNSSIGSDYIFEQWLKPYEQSREQDPQIIKLKVSSQRKQTFKNRTILNLNYENNNDYVITTKSQAQQRYQCESPISFISNFEGKKDEYYDNYSKQIKNSKNKCSYRHFSQSQKSQKEDFDQQTESIANCSTIFSQHYRNSKRNSLGFSLNCKLPKIKQIKSQNKLLRKFKVISKVIGKIISLFYYILPNTSPKKSLYSNKLKIMLNQKNIFKFNRNIDESLSQSFRKWIGPSLQKIFFHLQNSLPKIFEMKVEETKEKKDQEEIWMLNFAKILFQNLELITRKGNIPKEIILAMSQTIYRKNNQYVQLFVAQRTQFQQYPLNLLEIQLICSEYILYNAIMISMFDLANNLKYQSFNHNVNCKIKILEIASIIDLYYIKIFKSMPIKDIDFEEEELYTRMIYITPNEDQFIYLLDVKEKNKMDSMILGLRNKDQVLNILQQRRKWNQKLEQLFKQFILNLCSQVEIFD